MASFALGKKKPPLVAPFIEFDGYVERVVQRGGIFYRLMFVHRYTGKQFSQTSLSTIVDHKHEVHALWDMLQRYMDVSQSLPDVPRLEPFRHLDPTTAEHDRQTGRDPTLIWTHGKQRTGQQSTRPKSIFPGVVSTVSSTHSLARSRWRLIKKKMRQLRYKLLLLQDWLNREPSFSRFPENLVSDAVTFSFRSSGNTD